MLRSAGASAIDALLVADRRCTQDVSKIVARLRHSNRRKQEQHLRNYRPWGYFEALSIGLRFQGQLLHVKSLESDEWTTRSRASSAYIFGSLPDRNERAVPRASIGL